MSGNQMEMCHLLFGGSRQVFDPPSFSFWQVMKQQGSKGSAGEPLEKSHLFQSPHSSSFKPDFLLSSPSLWWLKAFSFARCRASHSQNPSQGSFYWNRAFRNMPWTVRCSGSSGGWWGLRPGWWRRASVLLLSSGSLRCLGFVIRPSVTAFLTVRGTSRLFWD